jgi:hypothetical protein
VTEKKFERIMVWRFIAGQNDDEIYAYGTDFQAKQFCIWLNYHRKTDRFTYYAVAVSEIPSIEHMVFDIKEVIHVQALFTPDNELPKKVKKQSILAIIAASEEKASHYKEQAKARSQEKAKILLAINTIIKWNCHHPKKFTITAPLVKRVTDFNHIFVRDAIIKQRQEIDRHHNSLGWEKPPGNRRMSKRDFEALADFIRERL